MPPPALSAGGVATLFTVGRAPALSITLQLLDAQEIGTAAGIQETWRLQLSDGVHSCRVTVARALAPLARALAPRSLVLVTAAACRQEDGRRCVLVVLAADLFPSAEPRAFARSVRCKQPPLGLRPVLTRALPVCQLRHGDRHADHGPGTGARADRQPAAVR